MIVEFSGWCQIDDEDVRLQYIGDETKKPIINGLEYNLLSDEEQDEYLLEDIIATLQESLDNEWDHINLVSED